GIDCAPDLIRLGGRMSVRVLVAGVAVVGVIVVPGMLLGPQWTRARLSVVLDPAQTAAAPAFAGTNSCSARACHGAIEPVAGQHIRQNEYSLGGSTDKHERAY